MSSKQKLIDEVEAQMFIETDYENRIVLVKDVIQLINEHLPGILNGERLDDVIAVIKDHAELEDAINWPERKPITAEQLKEVCTDHKYIGNDIDWKAMADELNGGSDE